jgi:hypothetical protein
MAYLPLPFAPSFAANAVVAPGSKLKFYQTRTTTPLAVYADPDLNTSLGVEITADAFGRFVDIYPSNDNLYRVRLETSGGGLIDEADDIGSAIAQVAAILGETGGADMIGTENGDTVQEALDKINQSRPMTPEDFAPNGVIDYDDVDECMDAFAGLSAWLQSNGGGWMALRPGAEYTVGREELANGSGPNGWMFEPDPIIQVDGATKPIIIDGNGAKLKCASGLRYGTFDSSGNPLVGQQPVGNVASPYVGMIYLSDCTGGIVIRNLELDGSNASASLGGGYGDVDRQIPATGIFLLDNEGALVIENVYTHHHCLDGVLVRHGDAASVLESDILISAVHGEYNARQGISIVGGRGGRMQRCKFNYTGRGAFHTAPAAGIDIEAEGSNEVVGWTFTDIETVENYGVGLLASAGNNSDCHFFDCLSVGSVNYAAWPQMPGFTFTDCLFVGIVLNPYAASAFDATSTRFVRCHWLNDTAYSPSGAVYLGSGGTTRLLDASGANFIIVQDCDINATGTALAVFLNSASNLIWNTRISQVSATALTPSATWQGQCSVTGGGTTSAAGNVRGFLTVNGTAQNQSDDLLLASTKVVKVNGTQVLTARQTGWGAATGTATRTTFATGSVTLPQLAERVKAVLDDLTTHGIIGA